MSSAAHPPSRPVSDRLFAGPSEMHAHGRRCDWAATALGSVETWSPALRAAVRLMLDAPSAMAVYAGPHFVTLYNDAYRSVLGAKHPAAFGRPAAQVWTELWPDVAPQFRLIFDEGKTLKRQGEAYTIARAETGAPETAWFDYALSPVREDDADDGPGAVVAIFNIVAETTERSRADEAVAVEREKLRSIILHMPVAMALHVGPDHRYDVVNEAYESTAGRGSLVGRTPRDVFPEFAGSGFFELLDRAYATGEPWMGPENHVPLRMPDGGTRDLWTTVRLEPVRNAEGEVTGLLNVSIDITAQVLARREVERLAAVLDSERALLRMLIEMMPAPVALHMGTEHRFEIISESFRRISGGRDLLGMTPREAYPELEGRGILERFDEVRATGNAWVQHELPARMDRRGIGIEDSWFDVRYEPVRDTGGEVVGILNFSFDVTAQVQARLEAEQLLAVAESARADAVAANRSKSEFLAIMSHELRTPLNAIDGYAELIELGVRGPITEDQRHDLARIRRSQKHLLGLINGVLNYARVEAGAVHYDLEAVAVEEVLMTCEALTAPQARNKRLALLREPCSPDLYVRADREKLQQVVLNLLSNAIKFTEAEGRIDVRCVSAQDDGGDVVHITVADTGIGIAPHQLARVFEPFVQVDTELTRTRDGTGLGLAISRDLARGMGGELTVKSTLGLGSTFTLSLRAEQRA